DATTGPSLATLVTAVSVGLPAAANNQPLVQVRVITSNAAANAEGVGVDDLSIAATAGDQPPSVASSNPANGAVDVPINTQPTVTFSEEVTLNAAGVALVCTNQGTKPVTLSSSPATVFTLTTLTFQNSDHCTLT